MILSLGVYLNRTSRPPVRALVPDRADPRWRSSEGEECSQLKIVEVHGSLFFGAIDHVQQSLQEIDGKNPQQKHVLVVADGINFADIAGAEMLTREARRRRLGGGLYLLGVKERTYEALRTGHYLEEIGEENLFRTRPEAIREIKRRLDATVCARCDARVFDACGRAAEPRQKRRGASFEDAIAAAAFAEEGDSETARRILLDNGEDGRTERPEEPRRSRDGGGQGPGAA